MELLVSLINGFPSLTNVANNILDVGLRRSGLHFRFLDMVDTCIQVNVCIICNNIKKGKTTH